jgi:phosphoribosylaminoimidazole-succinocarboxamide synthase
MKVKKIHIERPLNINGQYEYSAYQKNLTQTLVPLEVIFRLALPEGNSLSKRMANDQAWAHYGYGKNPGFGLLEMAIVDFSTKLEKGDRYIDYDEAQKIAGMTSAEFQSLKEHTHLVGIMLYSFHQKIGLDLWDGKLEWAFGENQKGERSFTLVDSIGLDEMRLKLNGVSFSKEFLREYYKSSSWYQLLEKAKKEVGMYPAYKGDFKAYCLSAFNEKPQPLDLHTLKKIEDVYLGYANSVCYEVFKKYPFGDKFSVSEYAKRYL